MAQLLKSAAHKKDMLFLNRKPIANLTELHNTIERFSEEEFTKHVDLTRCAKWVERMYADDALAESLPFLPDKESVLFSLSARIKQAKPTVALKPHVQMQHERQTLTPKTHQQLLEELEAILNP